MSTATCNRLRFRLCKGTIFFYNGQIHYMLLKYNEFDHLYII